MNEIILLKDIADLESDYQPSSVDLCDEYWQPEEEGEKRRMLYLKIAERRCKDQETGEDIDLECVVFVEPSKDESHKTVVNGSVRLVGVFRNGGLQPGQPVEVTYRGKKRNRTNQNSSDTWSVVTLEKKAK